MEREQVIFEVLEATGLNWTVSKKPIYFGEGNVVPKHYANVRSDNNFPLAIVGDQYSILQNHETVGLVYDAGAEVFDENSSIKHPWNNSETLGTFGNMAGGSLKKGRAIFVQLQLPEANIGKSGVKRFITIANHHDGSKALGFGTTNQVICCENTFAIANKELSKMRHTASMHERVDEAVEKLRKVLQFEEKQMEIFDKASSMPIHKKHMQEVIETLFGKDKVHSADASTRLKNQVIALGEDINTSIDEQGESLWAIFNGVTRFTNHTRVTKDKDYSLMFGSDAKMNQKAFRLLETWVG